MPLLPNLPISFLLLSVRLTLMGMALHLCNLHTVSATAARANKHAAVLTKAMAAAAWLEDSIVSVPVPVSDSAANRSAAVRDLNDDPTLPIFILFLFLLSLFSASLPKSELIRPLSSSASTSCWATCSASSSTYSHDCTTEQHEGGHMSVAHTQTRIYNSTTQPMPAAD